MKRFFGAMVLVLIMIFGASAQADGIILPDPSFYFNRACEKHIIEFDDYPQAEYEAYVSLLREAYGMEIAEEKVSERYEYVYLEAPGIENSRTLVGCFTNSKGSGMEFDFGEGVTLSALDVYTPDTEVYQAPIVGNDGLNVMSPEQYLGIEPCDRIYQQDNYYAYKYIDRGFEKYGKENKNLEDWYAMEDYLNALIDSGYYEIIEHTISKTKYVEYWCLGYTGSKPIKVFGANKSSTQEAAILIQSHYGHIYVRYSVDILTDDLDETQKRLGENLHLDDPDPDPDPDEKARCMFCNKGSCKNCGGTGFVYGYSSYEKDWREKKDCSSCIAGRCSHCGGDGWR